MAKSHLKQSRVADCEFPVRLTNLLVSRGFHTLADIAALGKTDREVMVKLLSMPGLGPRFVHNEIMPILQGRRNLKRDKKPCGTRASAR